jgi:ribonuclease HI
MYFDGSLMKRGAGAGLLFISPLGKHVLYVLRLHFPASNNVAEYEALVNGLRIAVELGVRRLDTRGDSQLVIDQVMKNSHCRDRKMEAYCDKVRRLEDKFYGLELNHIARRYNETVDELAKIASGQTTVPPDIFSRDIHQPSVKINDTPEPEEASPQPEVPSPAEGEALRVEGERNGVTPNPNWQTLYLEYLLRGELPLDKVEARRLAWRAKSFVLLGDENELYHRSPSGILQRCISVAEGQELLQEIHLGACGHHAAPRALVGNAFRQGFYWPTPPGLYAPAKGVNSMQDRRTCLLRPCRQYPSPSRLPCGVWTSLVPCRRHPGLLAPVGRHRQILLVDRGPTLNQHQVRAGGGVLHKHYPSLWGPELHHHRQWHAVHREEVPGLLRGPPHPCGLGRRSSPHDEWAGGACQRYDFVGT